MPGNKGFQVTGSIGNVMNESARAALSYVRSRADKLGLGSEYFEKSDNIFSFFGKLVLQCW